MPDYINRDEVMLLLQEKQPVFSDRTRTVQIGIQDLSISEATDEISALPAADVAPVKHGFWADRMYYKCSVCGAEIDYPFDQDGRAYVGCPMCLARMDAKEDAK